MFGGGDEFSGTQVDGGYMQSPAQGRGGLVSPSPYGAKRAVGHTGLRSCTIKQIIMAPLPEADTNFLIDGLEVQHVEIVGLVKNIDVQSTNLTFLINDTTGQISVKHWNNNDGGDNSEEAQMQNYKGRYVRVVGKVNVFKGKKNVNSMMMKPLKSHNEMNLHLLTALHAHLSNLTPSGDRLDFNGDAEMKDMEENNKGNSMMGNAMEVDMDGDDVSNLDKRIISFVKTPAFMDSEEGASIEQIFEAFHDVDMNDVREAVERLSNGGELYTTISEEHFKSSTG